MRHLGCATPEILLLPLGVIRPSIRRSLVLRARPPKRLGPSSRCALLRAVAAPTTATAFAEHDRAPAAPAFEHMAAVLDRVLPGADWTPWSRSVSFSGGLLCRSRVASWGPGAPPPGPRPVSGYDIAWTNGGPNCRRVKHRSSTCARTDLSSSTGGWGITWSPPGGITETPAVKRWPRLSSWRGSERARGAVGGVQVQESRGVRLSVPVLRGIRVPFANSERRVAWDFDCHGRHGLVLLLPAKHVVSGLQIPLPPGPQSGDRRRIGGIRAKVLGHRSGRPCCALCVQRRTDGRSRRLDVRRSLGGA